MLRIVLLGLCALAGVACSGAAPLSVGVAKQELRAELEKVASLPTCPEADPEAREAQAVRAFEGSQVEADRSRLDLRAPYRAYAMAALALACTEPQSPERVGRERWASARKSDFLGMADRLAHQAALSMRAGSAAANAQTLRRLGTLVGEAAPEFAARLRAKARLAIANKQR